MGPLCDNDEGASTDKGDVLMNPGKVGAQGVAVVMDSTLSF